MGKVWEIFSSPALCARHLMLRLEGSVSGILRGRLSSSCGFFPGQSTVEGRLSDTSDSSYADAFDSAWDSSL